MYAYIHIYICIDTYAYIYTHINVRTCVYTYICVFIYIYIYMYILIRKCLYVATQKFMNTYIHIYIYTHTYKEVSITVSPVGAVPRRSYPDKEHPDQGPTHLLQGPVCIPSRSSSTGSLEGTAPRL